MTSDRYWHGSEELTAWGHAKPPTKPRRGKSNVEPWQTCTKDDIKQYRKYNVLYGERKFARSFAEQKQTLSFTEDLPTEVRLLVYEYIFQKPDYFELWAPWSLTKRSRRRQNQFNTYASKKKALRIMPMTVFNHTVGRNNCDFIKHITVQIPNRDYEGWPGLRHQGAYACMWYIAEWNAFQKIQTRRGMRIPDFGFRMKHYGRGRVRGEYNYEKAVHRGYRQLRTMASLKTLEILIPWDYEFIDELSSHLNCHCSLDYMKELAPSDRVRHFVEEHSTNPEYWALLADLKRQTTSKDMTISLVLKHHTSGYVGFEWSHFLRQGRWLAAYASVMGYRFGHMRWEDNGTYVVRYDKDEMLSVSPEEMEDEEKALLEPPDLSVRDLRPPSPISRAPGMTPNVETG